MSQISLYRLNIVAGANGRDCVGVAQLIGEYKTGVLPRLPGAEFAFQLGRAMLSQHLHNECRRNDYAAFAVLGWLELVLAVAIVLILQLLIDCDRPSEEVNAFPTEAKDLALPQSGEKGKSQKSLVFVAVDLLQESGDLLIIQRPQLLSLDAGQDTGGRRVKPQIC